MDCYTECMVSLIEYLIVLGVNGIKPGNLGSGMAD